MNTENQLTVELHNFMINEETKVSLAQAFTPFFEQTEEWKEKALALKITSHEQITEMADARTARLALKAIRVEAKKAHDSLKEESKLKGRAIDGMYNIILAQIVPIEKHLQEHEDFIKIQLEQQRAERLELRESKLEPFDVDTSYINLADMPEDDFTQFYEMSKRNHESQLAKIREAEQDRIAKEKAESEERERIRIENEKLKKEAEIREQKAEAERKAREIESEKIRKANEAKIKAEQEKAAKIQAELDKKKAAEEKAIRDAEMKAEAERKAAEETTKKEAQRPDKQKLINFAAEIAAIELPDLKSDNAKKVLEGVKNKLNETWSFITNEAKKL
ncbi:MAG: hypothetical protein KAR20_00525 [Candidatus Heimdallarchaeota archaeon]|nr:hypothetical protein [Candidatus Heimdallarchaeota archaeon]